MPKITDVVSLSSGFTPAWENIDTLDLAGPVFPSGAFGDVYDLAAVNGAPPPSRQIVKVLRDNGQGSNQKGIGTIEKLQRRIVEVNQHRATSSRLALQELPALRALPQFSFRGRMGNLPVCGYSADRLDTAGYLPFAAFLDVDEDPRPRERYVRELGMDDRLLLAHELAEGFDALRELWYIHGDLNPPNLFVNVDERHVAIIDFDSGAVTDAPDESPTTFGKLTEGEWLAPEIMEQMLKNRTQRATVQVTQFTDNWAVAVGIHYLLFLCGPFFLLARPNLHNIRNYAAHQGWPRRDPADPLFAPGMDAAYRIYTELLQEVPTEVIRRMRDTMTVGIAAPGRRPTYYQWTAALKSEQSPMEVPMFQIGPPGTVVGQPIRISWSVRGARRVTIDRGIGDVESSGSRVVFAVLNQVFTLTAENHSGKVITKKAVVEALPGLTTRELSSISFKTRDLPDDTPRVFVGHNRADRRWLKRVESHLKVMRSPAKLDVWDDSRIGGGLGWCDDVERALRSATVAVLLMSADFLVTDFEHDFELLRLLLNAEGEGTVILPVIVSACKYEETPWLERLPPVNEPQRPVDSL
ncbi:MAG TPA: TIR domain-containing protein, partial [Longimicrobium sp.]|nr:TIR domain-containing protein [Longimicrobium sp.]